MSPGPRITDQSAQSFVWLGLGSLQLWRLHSFSRQAGPGLIAVMVTDFFFSFPLANQALPCSVQDHYHLSCLRTPPLCSAFSITSLLDFPRPVQDHCHLSCLCAPSDRAWLCLLNNLPSWLSKAPIWHQPAHGKQGPDRDLFQNCLSYLYQHWNTH